MAPAQVSAAVNRVANPAANSSMAARMKTWMATIQPVPVTW